MKFKSNIELQAGLEDNNATPGTSGQVLSSTSTGVEWIDTSTISVGESEQVHIACKNTSGIAISKGDPVYITGTVGTSLRIQIAKADASDPAKMPAVGLVETDLGLNAEGFVIVSGILKNLTTDPLSTSDGTPSSNDTVYVKAGGGLTRIKPTGSGNLIQNVGKVGRVSSANSGSLAVSTIMRTNDIPNLNTGKIWVGSPTYTTESTVVSIDEANDKVIIAGTIDLNDGNGSTIIGTSAGGGGTNITAVGRQALESNTGNNACGFGEAALAVNTGTYTCGFGYNTLLSNGGDYANGFGTGALAYNVGNYSNGFGSDALSENTGNNSNGFGDSALQYNLGNYSNGFGNNALTFNTGDYSNGFGYNALQNNTGIYTNGFGHNALMNNNGDFLCGFGHNALRDNNGDNVSGFGGGTLFSNQGNYANAFGGGALASNTGNFSNGFGNSALYYNQGDFACGFGHFALIRNVGENNTAIGYYAGGETASQLTGSNNTFLGAKASYGTNTTISNSTAVGANITLTDSNTVILGNGASVGIGTTSPLSKLQVNGGVQMADDTDTASVGKVGTLRYRADANNSYVDMCMQTGASTYEWINIVQNNW